MQKIQLYYKFTPISDPEVMQLWQKTLCDSLNLRGRILISKHGLNGTVGGDIEDLKKYIKATKEFPGFKGTVNELVLDAIKYLPCAYMLTEAPEGIV